MSIYFNAKFGPGRYFIGDICYALPDEVYDKIWGDKYEYEEGCYEGFAVSSTAYGDGCFKGTDGVDYSVDAGVLGITDISKHQRYDDETLSRLGKIVEVKDSISIEKEGAGNFIFTVDGEEFSVNTGYEEDEEDEIY